MPILLLSQLRRSSGTYLGCVAFTAAIWALPLPPLIWELPPATFSPQWVIAWSVMVAYIAGPAVSFRLGAGKELALLPVSWRERWRTEWTLAVLVPLLVTTMGQLLGLAITGAVRRPRGTVDVILLSALFDAAYLGFSAGLLTSLRRRGRSRPPWYWPANRRLVVYLLLFEAFGIIGLVLFGGFSGFILYRFLPTDLAALRGFTGWLIAAGIGIGTWTWFYWSALGPQPARFARVPSGLGAHPSIPLPRESSSVAGTSGLFQSAVKKACVRAAVLAAIAAPFLLLTNRDVVKFVWLSVAFMVGAGDWQAQLRQLRLLPVSTMTLNLALLARPAMLWTVTGILMAAARFVTPSRSDGIPLLAILGVIFGVSVLGHAVSLRRNKTDLVVIVTASLAISFGSKLLRGVELPSLPAWPFPMWTAVAGFTLAALAAAAVVNHRTLTRSSTAYKPAPVSPFGVRQTR